MWERTSHNLTLTLREEREREKRASYANEAATPPLPKSGRQGYTKCGALQTSIVEWKSSTYEYNSHGEREKCQFVSLSASLIEKIEAKSSSLIRLFVQKREREREERGKHKFQLPNASLSLSLSLSLVHMQKDISHSLSRRLVRRAHIRILKYSQFCILYGTYVHIRACVCVSVREKERERALAVSSARFHKSRGFLCSLFAP